jgi:hypothetical protein
MKFTDQAGPPPTVPSKHLPSSTERHRRFHVIIAYWGVFPLERCDEYRRFAEACIELARHQETPQERAVLLQMALIWSRLAEQAVTFAKDGYWPGSEPIGRI